MSFRSYYKKATNFVPRTGLTDFCVFLPPSFLLSSLPSTLSSLPPSLLPSLPPSLLPSHQTVFLRRWRYQWSL